MTICIGVICEERKKAIVALDRMLTSRALSVQFEHDETKFDQLSDTSLALTAGEALTPTKLFRDVRSKVKPTSSLSDICDIVKEVFLEYKLQRVEEKYFKPRKLSISKFYAIQKQLNPDVVRRLEMLLEREVFNVEILLVGVDRSGAHIYQISDPGTSECFDSLSFHAIGSGLPHAMSTLISYNYTPCIELKKASYIIYEAKKNAERAPGVGKTTDMAIINEKEIKFLSDDEIGELDKIYKEKGNLGQPILKTLEKMIHALPF